MAFKRVINVRNTGAYFVDEVTPGTLPATDVDKISMVDMTISVSGTDDVFNEAGRNFPVDIETHSESVSGQINVPFRANNDHDAFLKLALRDSAGFPAEVIQAPATADFVSARADLDGVSRPALVVPSTLGGFDVLKAASSQSECGGLWLRISGATTAGNNSGPAATGSGPKLIMPGSPRDDTGDTVMNFDLRSFQAASLWGGTAGAWISDDALETALSLDIGHAAIAQSAPATGDGTISIVIRYADGATTLYSVIRGVILSAPTLSWNGRGGLMWNFAYVGKTLDAITDSDPVGGSYLDTNAYDIIPRGGSGLSRLALLTDGSVIILDGDNVNSPTTAIEGAAELILDTVGATDAAGWTLTPMSANWGFNYLVKGEASSIAEQVEAIATIPTRVLTTKFYEFTAPNGDQISLTFPESSLKTAFTSAAGGASGPQSGTFAGMAQTRIPNLTAAWPDLVVQKWTV